MMQFWKDATERAIKSFAQAELLVLGADRLNVLDADWANALGFGAGAIVLSYLTSLLSFRFGNSGTASLTTAVEPAGRHEARE